MDRLQDHKKKANGDENFVKVKDDNRAPQLDVFSDASWRNLSVMMGQQNAAMLNRQSSKETIESQQQIPMLG